VIFVDDRIGSRDLGPDLEAVDLPVSVVRMESADVAFEGRGIGGHPVDIGVELKKLTTSDLVDSLRTGRLAGEQLPKMLGEQGAYDYAWIVVEGSWRLDRFGRILTKSRDGWHPLPGRMTGAEMEKQLLTLDLCGGARIRFTVNRAATVQFLSSLYRWWTDKNLDDHRSHLSTHEPVSFFPVSPFCAAIMKWPEIGLKTALAAEAAFGGSVMRAAMATTTEWAAIETVDKKGTHRRLGMKAATRIVQFVTGEL